MKLKTPAPKAGVLFYLPLLTFPWKNGIVCCPKVLSRYELRGEAMSGPNDKEKGIEIKAELAEKQKRAKIGTLPKSNPPRWPAVDPEPLEPPLAWFGDGADDPKDR